jgi:hypothetical protein
MFHLDDHDMPIFRPQPLHRLVAAIQVAACLPDED